MIFALFSSVTSYAFNKKNLTVDLSKIKTCPPSITISNQFPLIDDVIPKEFWDKDGNFYIHASPFQFQKYLSENIENGGFKAVVISSDKISKEALKKTVIKNIKFRLPTIVFVVENCDTLETKYRYIVAIEGDVVEYVEHSGDNKDMRKSCKIDELIKMMDASPIIKLVNKLYELDHKISLFELVSHFRGHIDIDELRLKWKPYSLITFDISK